MDLASPGGSWLGIEFRETPQELPRKGPDGAIDCHRDGDGRPGSGKGPERGKGGRGASTSFESKPTTASPPSAVSATGRSTPPTLGTSAAGAAVAGWSVPRPLSAW